MSTPLGAENQMSTGTDKVSEVLSPPPSAYSSTRALLTTKRCCNHVQHEAAGEFITNRVDPDGYIFTYEASSSVIWSEETHWRPQRGVPVVTWLMKINVSRLRLPLNIYRNTTSTTRSNCNRKITCDDNELPNGNDRNRRSML